MVFCTYISLAIASSGMIAGREPTAEDMEPMSWAIYSMVQGLNAIQGLGAVVQLQAFARQLITFLEPYDALLTPALAERPLPLGTLDTAAPDPMSTFTRSGLFTPFTPVFNATGQPGISLPLYQGEDGLPLGVQLVGRPAGEAALLALAMQLEEACRGQSGDRRSLNDSTRLSAGRGDGELPRTADNQENVAQPGWLLSRTAPIGLGTTPSRSASPAPEAATIEHSISSASSQVANARSPSVASSRRSPRETIGVGTCSSGRGRSSESSTSRTISVCVSVSGPASS